jgi:hypothetical protein
MNPSLPLSVQSSLLCGQASSFHFLPSHPPRVISLSLAILCRCSMAEPDALFPSGLR